MCVCTSNVSTRIRVLLYIYRCITRVQLFTCCYVQSITTFTILSTLYLVSVHAVHTYTRTRIRTHVHTHTSALIFIKHAVAADPRTAAPSLAETPTLLAHRSSSPPIHPPLALATIIRSRCSGKRHRFLSARNAPVRRGLTRSNYINALPRTRFARKNNRCRTRTGERGGGGGRQPYRLVKLLRPTRRPVDRVKHSNTVRRGTRTPSHARACTTMGARACILYSCRIEFNLRIPRARARAAEETRSSPCIIYAF